MMRPREGKDSKFKKTSNKNRNRRPKKIDPLIGAQAASVDYKNSELLAKFLTEKGKIIPRRISGCSAKSQRRLSRAVRRARHAGLIAFEAE